MKGLSLLILMLLIGNSSALAQTDKREGYGMSPEEIEAERKILFHNIPDFLRVYNGGWAIPEGLSEIKKLRMAQLPAMVVKKTFVESKIYIDQISANKDSVCSVNNGVSKENCAPYLTFGKFYGVRYEGKYIAYIYQAKFDGYVYDDGSQDAYRLVLHRTGKLLNNGFYLVKKEDSKFKN